MDLDLPKAEPSYLYSNRSYWYPQAPITDYATASIRITVPAGLDCVASGEPAADSPILIAGKDPSQARKRYTFYAMKPLRYLSFVMSRFSRADHVTIAFDPSVSFQGAADPAPSPALPGPSYTTLDLVIDANPRQVSRGRNMADTAIDLAQFYRSILGDSPYSSFTVALVENALPGGHS